MPSDPARASGRQALDVVYESLPLSADDADGSLSASELAVTARCQFSEHQHPARGRLLLRLLLASVTALLVVPLARWLWRAAFVHEPLALTFTLSAVAGQHSRNASTTGACSQPPWLQFAEEELTELRAFAFVDPAALHPDSYPPPQQQWRAPQPPSAEQFAASHPAFPPARFLAAFAQGGWTERFERFELQPQPALQRHSALERLVRQQRLERNATGSSTRRLYCQHEEDDTYRPEALRRLPLPSSCARMWWYSAGQACWILSHFTALFLSGDSLMRQVHEAMLQLLTDNLSNGQVRRQDRENGTARLCTGERAYSSEYCRPRVAFDTRELGFQACPSLHRDALPWARPPQRWTPETAAGGRSDASAAVLGNGTAGAAVSPWLPSVLQAQFHGVFVRDNIAAHPYSLPPMLTAAERGEMQRQRLRDTTAAKAAVTTDSESYVYALPDHIGALLVDGLGFHKHESDLWPVEQRSHYDDVLRAALYESHSTQPPQPVFPLYLGLHVMVAARVSKDYRSKLSVNRTAEVVATIMHQTLLQHSPSHYYASHYSDLFTVNSSFDDGDDAVDLSLLHYSELQMSGTVRVDEGPVPPRWQLDSELRTCHFAARPPGASSTLEGRNSSRRCCSHSVRPWQLLDPARLTAHVPHAWSYDGVHYGQWINLWKAQAILNYAHTLIQLHATTAASS